MRRGGGATIEAWVYRKPASKWYDYWATVRLETMLGYEGRGREPGATSRGQGHARAAETLAGVCVCMARSCVWEWGHSM